MATRADRYESRHKLLATAASWMASEFHSQTRLPGPHDDAEAELNDDRLLAAAREYVEAHEGVEVLPG